jgi:hypothetical protein
VFDGLIDGALVHGSICRLYAWVVQELFFGEKVIKFFTSF